MNYLIEQGLVFYWGTSEWSEAQLAEALHYAEKSNLIPPLFEQCEYSMLSRGIIESELTPFYPKLGTTVWSPLAGGVLSGKYGTDQSKWKPEWRGSAGTLSLEQAQIAEDLKPIAARLGCTLAQLALAWCCANPNVSSVIMGFTRISQLEDNLGALAVIPLITAEVLAEIEGVLGNAPVVSGSKTMAMVNQRREALEAGGHWIEMAAPKL
jgi:aryl-alcohol dehydrogenase-like predicted oxidoreductase